jgi:hypothetical protein
MTASSPPGSNGPVARRRRGLFALALVLPLAIYVALALRFLSAGVGFEMDEALYVQSAVFLLHGTGTPPFVFDPATWITVAGRPLPLMIIPYVGALKAWVALPLFAMFGAGAETARYSGVLLGCVGIAGLGILVATRTRKAAGLAVALLLAVHPSYLDFTVFDNGGVSVWMAAMGLSALALAVFLRRRTIPSALLVGIAAGLGVWGRANVLWLLAAAIAAALLVAGRRAIPAAKHSAAMALGAVLGGLPLALYEFASKLGTLRFMSDTRQPVSRSMLVQRLRGLAEVMVSDGEQTFIWGGRRAGTWELGLGAVLCALVLVAVFAPARPNNVEISRWRRGFAVTAVLLAGIMLASGLNVSQHHLVAVVPLALAALAVFAVEIGRRPRSAGPLFAATAVALAGVWLGADFRIDDGLRRTGGRRVFSSGIEDVRAFLAANPLPPERLKILDWGFQNNLYVLSGGSTYGTELYWAATKTASSRGLAWESEIRDGGSFLLFLFKTDPALSAGSEGFRQALASYTGPRRDEVFFDRTGHPYARLIEIPPTP